MPDLHSEYAKALQEYLEVLADSDGVPAKRLQRLLLSYAEFQFKLRGGSRCAVCRASVRHVLPVDIEYMDGTKLRYKCLCTRCMEAEKAVAKRVVLQVGEAYVEHVARSQPLKPDHMTAKAG